MSKELSLVLEDGIAFQTGPDLSQLYIDGGVVRAGEYVIPKSAIGNSLDPIKKRAATLPLFADKMERDCE